MKQQDFILKTYPFLIVFFVFVLFGMTMIAYHGKEQLHLEYNQIHFEFTDVFFKYYTDFSVTGITIIVLLILIFKRTWRDFVLYIVSYLVLTGIATLIKKSFFEHVYRPTFYFNPWDIAVGRTAKQASELHTIEGIRDSIPYTFPSGHTMTAFLCFLFLCLIYKNKFLQIGFALLACLVGISRVYLSKHFVLDTIGGSFLAVFGLMFFYYWINTWKMPWLDKPILNKAKNGLLSKK